MNASPDGWRCTNCSCRARIRTSADLKIFSNCRNLIRTLPALQHDKRNPSDTANTPHELTHAPDALRGYAATVYEPVKAMPQSAYDCEVGEFLRF